MNRLSVSSLSNITLLERPLFQGGGSACPWRQFSFVLFSSVNFPFVHRVCIFLFSFWFLFFILHFLYLFSCKFVVLHPSVLLLLLLFSCYSRSFVNSSYIIFVLFDGSIFLFSYVLFLIMSSSSCSMDLFTLHFVVLFVSFLILFLLLFICILTFGPALAWCVYIRHFKPNLLHWPIPGPCVVCSPSFSVFYYSCFHLARLPIAVPLAFFTAL